MERDAAITLLPVIYQRVLSSLDEGCSGEEIAARLRIDTHAVEPLIRLAHAKLTRLRAEASSTDLGVPINPTSTGAGLRDRVDRHDPTRGADDVHR